MTIRQAATAARREQIIRAAIALLAERGYQATTFEAICEEAGLSSKRLITYHFSSKDELFAAVADQIVADGETFMRPAIAAATGARELPAAVTHVNVEPSIGGPTRAYGIAKRALNRWVRRAAPTPEWAGAGIALNAVASPTGVRKQRW
jgi:AcrR family transcriptional regulator